MRKITLLILFISVLFMSGCHVDKTVYLSRPPVPPTGLTSITGDEAVHLFWYRVEDNNIGYYAIYRNTTGPSGLFEFQDEVSANRGSWTDYDVDNGTTYYYTVSAVDYDGSESDLSDYTYDTPRPEGFNVTIYDYHDPNYEDLSGYDLFYQERLHYNSVNCDIYLEYDDYYDAFFINVRHDEYLIQDFGYAESFDDVSYAPLNGWSGFSSVEAIEGHIYILKLWHFDEWHYARIWVTDFDLNPHSMQFSWAYQVDPGNRELKIRPDIDGSLTVSSPAVSGE